MHVMLIVCCIHVQTIVNVFLVITAWEPTGNCLKYYAIASNSIVLVVGAIVIRISHVISLAHLGDAGELD